MAVKVSTLNKSRLKILWVGESAHGMHSVKVEAHRHYASISPKGELKVQVFLNVGHLQGFKVATSGPVLSMRRTQFNT